MDWRSRLYNFYVSSGQGGAGIDGFAAQSGFLKRIIHLHVPSDRSIKILDLGSGDGRLLYWLERCGYLNARGVDFSKEMVDLSLKRGLENVTEADLIEYIKSIPDNDLDVVFAMDVLEHFDRSEIFVVCDQIMRILKPGGKIVSHVPNAAGLFGSLVRYGDLTHELAFTPSSMGQLFRAVGFECVRCFEDRPVPKGLKSLVRYILWEVGTFFLRVLYVSETARFDCVLSQNMISTATVPMRN